MVIPVSGYVVRHSKQWFVGFSRGEQANFMNDEVNKAGGEGSIDLCLKNNPYRSVNASPA